MKKYLKIIVGLVVIGIIAAIAVGLYVFRKAPESVANKKADIIVSCKQLVSEYETDEQAANQKYLDKVLEVTGIVADISNDSSGINITLRDNESIQGVVCRIVEKNDFSDNISVGDSITVKGICTGYLMDVILNKGVIMVKH